MVTRYFETYPSGAGIGLIELPTKDIKLSPDGLYYVQILNGEPVQVWQRNEIFILKEEDEK